MQDFFLNLLLGISTAVAFYLFFVFVKYEIHHHQDQHRSLNMVFLKIQIPKRESKEDLEQEQASFSASKDFKEVLGIATHMFESLHSIYIKGFTHYFTGQDFLSF
ncbi:MAG: hypothetical protein WCX45_06140, partial [Candidatus Gracilibacteria bacterium]